MDIKEILKFGVEGVFWTGGALISYLVLLGGVSAVSSRFSEKIKSQGDLERITNEEKTRLGLKKDVEVFLVDYLMGISGINEEGVYEIWVGGSGATRDIVKHELYHIYKHTDKTHKNRFLRNLNYFFREEPQAIAYQVFNWKL